MEIEWMNKKQALDEETTISAKLINKLGRNNISNTSLLNLILEIKENSLIFLYEIYLHSNFIRISKCKKID